MVLSIANRTGASAAQNVTAVVSPGGDPSDSVSLVSGPTFTGINLAAGESQDFTYVYDGTAEENPLYFTVTVQGDDVNSGDTIVSDEAQSNAVQIVPADPTLTASWVEPAAGLSRRPGLLRQAVPATRRVRQRRPHAVGRW